MYKKRKIYKKKTNFPYRKRLVGRGRRMRRRYKKNVNYKLINKIVKNNIETKYY